MRFEIFFLWLLLGAGAGTGWAQERVESTQPVDASEYSLGANMLRGEVLSISGRTLKMRDSTTGEPVTVKATDEFVLLQIRPGDMVRVSFSRDGETAAQIYKEPARPEQK